MKFSDRRGFILFAYPKAASTSMIRLLRPHCEDTVAWTDWPADKHVRPVQLLAAWRDRGREALFWSHLKITTVRNPWARVVSLHTYLRQKGYEVGPFGKWLEQLSSDPRKPDGLHNQVHAMDAHRWAGFDAGLVDAVLRVEYLAEELAPVMRKLDLPESVPEVANQTEHPPYRDLYTAKTRQIVTNRYARDIARWNYHF